MATVSACHAGLGLGRISVFSVSFVGTGSQLP